MEYLPKIFAKKFEPYRSHAFIKIFGLVIGVLVSSEVSRAYSPFLSEVLFFTGSSITFIVLIGFASVKHYEKKSEFVPSNPILLSIVATRTFKVIERVFSSASRWIFLLMFHLFILFSLLAIAFPFVVRAYGS